MALGIDKTIEVFDDLGNLSAAGIGVFKAFAHGGGIGAILGSIGKLASIAKAVEELVRDVPGALPELLDLDAAEAAKVGAAAYGLAKKIFDAVKA